MRRPGQRPRPRPAARCGALAGRLAVAALAALAGCASDGPTAEDPFAAEPAPAPAPLDEAPPAAPVPPPAIRTARSAALVVSTMPPLEDEAARREILLHAALYRAAWETNVGDFTRHFLLEPAPLGPLARRLPPGEFRLRLLAELDDVGRPVAWEPGPGLAGTDPDAFPGTRQLATRLGFRIIERQADGPTVVAEVHDRTPHVGASRQRVTATWSGGDWTIERDPLRLIY